MAIVPHFNGGESIPVSRTARPAIDRERRHQVDAGSIMAALGQGAQSIAASAVQTPTMPVGTFDGQYQGAQAFAAGLSNLGDAFTRIELARVEAKNYADVQETLTGAEVLATEFDNWRQENPDPEKWGAEFQRRMGAFAKNYQSRKDLSPQARAEIDARLSRFGQLEAVRVQGAATKATIGRAREAGMARYQTLVDRQDLQGAVGTLDELESRGLIYADDRVNMELDARDKIEARQIDEMKNRAETALYQGDVEGAKKLIAESPLSPDEKEAQIAKVEHEHGRRIKLSELQEAAVLNPAEVIGRLEKRDGDKWANESGLSIDDRVDVLNFAKAQANEYRVDAVNYAVEEIAAGRVKTEAQLKGLASYDELSAVDRSRLSQAIRDGSPNDPAEYSEMLTAVTGFDPADDPTGLKKADLLTGIAIRFKGAYADELSARLKEKIDGFEERKAEVGGMFGPVAGMDLTRSVSDVFSMIDEDTKAGVFGEWMKPAGQVKRLSQADAAKLKAGEIKAETMVEDLDAKADAARKALLFKQKVEAASKRDEGKTPAGLFDYYRSLVAPDQDSRATRSIDSLLPTGTGIGGEASLFPAGQTKEAVESADELIKRYANP